MKPYSIKEIESLRKTLNLSDEAFSLRLGYSSRAYANARTRRSISRWMQREIALRFSRHISEQLP